MTTGADQERLPEALRRPSGRLPFGYDPVPGMACLMIPDYRALAKLNEALDAVARGASYSSATRWLRQQTGRKLADWSLQRIYERNRCAPTPTD
jgi:hypothetical protein